MFLEMSITLRSLVTDITATSNDLANKIKEFAEFHEKAKFIQTRRRGAQKLKTSFHEFIWLHASVEA